MLETTHAVRQRYVRALKELLELLNRLPFPVRQLTLTAVVPHLCTLQWKRLWHWRTQRGGRGFKFFLNCLFSKYILQALLLYIFI